jgi:pimeloyl-ACP methyl ester carboxylesterase
MTDTAKETTIDAGGVGVAIREEGKPSGRPLVFLHGGGRTLADWVLVAPLLRDDYRLVLVDFRGHGLSDAVPTYSFDDGVADCAAVIDTLGLEDAVVIGHSLGGMTAIRYGSRVGRCAAIVNVDGFGTGHPAEFPGYSEDDARSKLERFADLSEEGFRAGGDRGDDAWYEDAVTKYRSALEGMGLVWSEVEPLVRRGYRCLEDGTWVTSPSSDVNASMYRSLFMFDHWTEYARLQVPLLVIRSTQEDYSGLDDPEDVAFLQTFGRNIGDRLDAHAAARPDVTVERFDTGHMVMWEKPVELADSIRRFVASL